MITWDETKRQANIEKHGLDFVGVEAIFEVFSFGFEDATAAYGEQRMILLGWLAGKIVHLTYTDLSTDKEEILRVISLREASPHEKALYIKEATA